MSEGERLDVRFDASGEESLSGYRPIHWTSVVGLCLGVLSTFSLLHWLLLSVAVAAILIGVVALRQIAQRDGELLGRKAALAGIALAVCFLGFVPTRSVTRRNHLDRQARQHAEQWFLLLRDGGLPNLYKAFELKKTYRERQPQGTDLALRYGDPREISSMDALPIDEEMNHAYRHQRSFHDFVEHPVVNQIIELGRNCELTWERVAGRSRSSNHDLIVLEYSIKYQDDGQRQTALFIEMGRNHYPDTREAHWYVGSLSRNLEDF